MNTVFVAAGPYSWGSSRMRAYWVAEKMGAAVVQYGDPLPAADIYVWQKSFDLDFIKSRQDKRHYWDVCDPIWWFSPADVESLIPWIDGAVFSSQALADDFKEWGGFSDLPIITIADRLDFAHFPMQRQHQQVSPVRFIWFGIAVNRIALNGALTNLARLAASGYKIELTIFDDRPDVQISGFDFPIYHIGWYVATENAVLAAHDVALLPPYPGPWGQVKSNNKTITAAACGLPATSGHNYGELTLLVEDCDMRQRGVDAYPLAHCDVQLSADEWETIICHS